MSRGAVQFIGGIVIAAAGIITGQGWLVGVGISVSLASFQHDEINDPRWADLKVATATSPVPVIYGKYRFGGNMVFATVSDGGRYLWLVVEICHGEIEAIDEIYLDGNLAVLADGTVRGDPADVTGVSAGTSNPCVLTKTGHGFETGDTVQLSNAGAITGDWPVTKIDANNFTIPTSVGSPITGITARRLNPGYSGKVSFAKYLGTDTQDTGTNGKQSGASGGTLVASDLTTVFPGWTTNHRGRGVAYVLLKIEWDEQRFTGMPNVECMVRGRKVYDPRSGTTAYSANPALCVRDYLTNGRYGRGLGASQVFDGANDSEGLRAEAAYCDELLEVPANLGQFTISSSDAATDRFTTAAAHGLAVVSINTSSIANPTVIATNAAHGLRDQQRVLIRGHMGSTPSINGFYTATVLSPTTFSIPVNVTVGGSGGTVAPAVWIRNHSGSSPAVSGTYGVRSVPTSTTFTLDDGNGAQLDITTGGTGGSMQRVKTQRRFECHGVIDTRLELKDNLEKLLTSCRGNLSFMGGVYQLYIRRPTAASSFEITEDMIVGGEVTGVIPGARSRPNVLRVTFVNPDRGWQIENFEWPPPTATNTYLSDDNNVRVMREIELPFTVNRFTAEQIAMVLLEEMRQSLSVEMECKSEALKLTVNDVVNASYRTPGWGPTEASPSNAKKKFWVNAMGMTPRATVALSLVEYQPTAYDLEMTDDAATLADTGLPAVWQVRAPSNLRLSSGTRDPRIKVLWDASPTIGVTRYHVQAKRESPANLADDWVDYAPVISDGLTAYIAPVKTGDGWRVRVRAVNAIGRVSDWVEATHTVLVAGDATCTLDSTYVSSTEIAYNVTFQGSCKRVEFYSRENDSAGGPDPVETAEYYSGVLKASGTKVIATQSSKYRRTLIVPYDELGVRGTPLAVVEHQATGGAGPGVPGTPVQGTTTQISIQISWTTGSGTPDNTRVYVNGQIVATVTPGTATTYTITADAAGNPLTPGQTILVKLDHTKAGVPSATTSTVSMTTTAQAAAATTFAETACEQNTYGSKTYTTKTFTWSGGVGGAWEIYESQSSTPGSGYVIASGASGTSVEIEKLSSSGSGWYYHHRYTNPQSGWKTSGAVNWSVCA